MDRTKSAKVSLFAVWTILLVLNVNGQSGCDTHRFANNIAFTSCTPLSALGSFLHWNYNGQNNTVSIAYRHPGTSSSSWIAWGLNPSGARMVGTQALVAFTNSSGQFQAYTSSVDDFSTQLSPGSLSFGVSLVSATLVNGEATIFATLELPANLVMTNQVWQEGPVANGVPQIHQTTGDNIRSIGRIDFRTGQSSASGGGSGNRLRRRNFAWILWYIWKGRNNKVFSNMDVDPLDTLKLAEAESKLWAEAQILNDNKRIQPVGAMILPSIPGRWCFTDGSWKENDIFSGQGWYSTLEGFAGLMGARNVRASLSPLHAEMEALLWAMECMKNLRQFQVTFATDCSQLVKMVSTPEEWPAFASYLEDINSLKESFSHAEIIYVPRTHNKKADSLARSARKETSFVVHMDQDLPVWFTESI